MDFQSEAQLEEELLHLLVEQNFTKVDINNIDDLLNNFRQQINILNTIPLKGNNLTDREFDRLLTQINGKSVYQSAKASLH